MEIDGWEPGRDEEEESLEEKKRVDGSNGSHSGQRTTACSAAGEKLGHYLTVSGRVGRLCSGTRPGPGMFWLVFFFSFWQRVQGKAREGKGCLVSSL